MKYSTDVLIFKPPAMRRAKADEKPAYSLALKRGDLRRVLKSVRSVRPEHGHPLGCAADVAA